MEKIKNWFKKKLSIISLALYNVEKNALSQLKNDLSENTNQTQRHTKGMLADSLKHGEVTQEVLNLKWRTYKILKQSDGLKSEIIGYDDNGLPITKTYNVNKKNSLKKIKVDAYDDYPLEMVVDNSPIAISTNYVMDNEHIKLFDKHEEIYNENGELIETIHGEIPSNEYFATNKEERPIVVYRLDTPKFFIENYANKLNIRSINEKEKLLEFYISLYPDMYDIKTKLLIKEIKKAIENPLHADILDIKKIGFITYKTIGAYDFLEYQYDDIVFDKIVTFNGFYVIKFKANVTVNGDDILEQHRVEELDKKYELKEKKIK